MLRIGHRQAGLSRIVAVAREHNFASRVVLGGIGMTECDSFAQLGHRMVMYESVLPSVATVLSYSNHTQLPDRPVVAQVPAAKDFQRTRP